MGLMDVMVWVKLRNLDLEFGTWLPVWLLPFSAQRLDFRKSVRTHSSSATFFFWRLVQIGAWRMALLPDVPCVLFASSTLWPRVAFFHQWLE